MCVCPGQPERRLLISAVTLRSIPMMHLSGDWDGGGVEIRGRTDKDEVK